MKIGDNVVKNVDILTIKEVEHPDVKTNFVTYVCSDGTRIPEQEIGNYTKIN